MLNSLFGYVCLCKCALSISSSVACVLILFTIFAVNGFVNSFHCWAFTSNKTTFYPVSICFICCFLWNYSMFYDGWLHHYWPLHIGFVLKRFIHSPTRDHAGRQIKTNALTLSEPPNVLTYLYITIPFSVELNPTWIDGTFNSLNAFTSNHHVPNIFHILLFHVFWVL